MTFVWRTGRAMARQLREIGAVLFEVDDTLVHVVRTPGAAPSVEPTPGALHALRRLRDAGLRVGVVSTRREIVPGHPPWAQSEMARARVDALLGPFDTWQACPRGYEMQRECRAPAPGPVLRAAESLGLPAHRLAVVGDVGSDIQAAQAAGAVGILVPSARTLKVDLRDAPLIAWSLPDGVELILGARSRAAAQARSASAGYGRAMDSRGAVRAP